nr:hypothetical protein sce6456 [uncultured bacterium]
MTQLPDIPARYVCDQFYFGDTGYVRSASDVTYA